MMDTTPTGKLRDFLTQRLIAAGDTGLLSNDASLFVSGRLDSLSMTSLVVFLEETFDIDFANVDFDVDLIDTIDDIQALVDLESARRGRKT